MKLCHLQHLVKFRQEGALVMGDVGVDSAWQRAPGEWVAGVSDLLN
jgi:hypothetical protein